MFINNTPISVVLKIFGIEPKFQESESCVLTNWTISPFGVPEIIYLFKRSFCNPSTISSLYSLRAQSSDHIFIGIFPIIAAVMGNPL
jgi:hypothetical protein